MPSFTNRQVMEAFHSAASDPVAYWTDIMIPAGLGGLSENQNVAYSGTNIPDLKNVPADVLDKVMTALGIEKQTDSGNKIDELKELIQEIKEERRVSAAAKLTHQKLINAFSDVYGKSYMKRIKEAGLTKIYNERTTFYIGTPISELPNLKDTDKKKLIEAIKLSGSIYSEEGDTSTIEIVQIKIVKLPKTYSMDVPWESQVHNTYGNDCGPASVLMQMKYHYPDLSKDKTIEEVLAQAKQYIHKTTTAAQVVHIGKVNNFKLDVDGMFDSFLNDVNLDILRRKLYEGFPTIVLVKYGDLGIRKHLSKENSAYGTHWFVAVGFDGDDFLVNDPLWMNKDAKEAKSLCIKGENMKTAIRNAGNSYPMIFHVKS